MLLVFTKDLSVHCRVPSVGGEELLEVYAYFLLFCFFVNLAKEGSTAGQSANNNTFFDNHIYQI